MCSLKRENNSIVLSSNHVILDIEGTTTSITFVKDVLFPYVRKHLQTYIEEKWDSEGFQAIVNALRIQAKEDKEKKLEGVVDIPEDCEKDDLAKAVIENVLWQMDFDSKAKSLKDLQGLIMEIGYNKGEIKGHVYEDVEPNLKLWTELGKTVYIYSSGSVHAQKLLYGHSEKGDLLPYIKGHFDTTVGKKGDAESYKKIMEQISGSPSETVFFTDVPKEAKAAKEAGLLAILLSREGNVPLTDEDKKEFTVIKSFSEIQFENISKKRKICTENDEKNDNKSVESCEVSLKTLKEPTHSTLIQQPDVSMEVEDSYMEDKNCNLGISDEKLETENVEDKNTQQKDSSNLVNSDEKLETENVEDKNTQQKDSSNLVNSDEKLETENVEDKNIQQKDSSNLINSDEKLETENVEEKNTQQKDASNLVNSDEKLETENVEDKNTEQKDCSKGGDVEIKPTNEVVEGNESEKDINVVEAQTNKDQVPKESDSQELKIEKNEPIDQIKKVNTLEPSELLDTCQKKVEPIVDKIETENHGNIPVTAITESQPCKEKTCPKANQVLKEPSQDIISENKEFTEEETVNASSNTQTQHNGVQAHNSSNENKCEPNNPCKDNKSDIEMVMEKSSENHKESLNPDVNGEEKNQSKLDLLNDSNSLTNENGLIDDKKLSESNRVSPNGNYSVESKVTNLSENCMEVDDKPCFKGSINSEDVMSKIISTQDVLPMDLDADTDKPKEKAVEKPKDENECVKESAILSMGSTSTISNTDVKVQENSSLLIDTKSTDDAISENIQSGINKSEEISSEPNKQINIEVNTATSDDIDTNSKPCIEATVDKSVLETSSTPQNVNESKSDKSKSGKMEMDEENSQMGEVGKKDKSDNELCSMPEKESELNDSVRELNKDVDLEKKAVTTTVADIQTQSDNIECSRQNSAEQRDEEKNEITKLSQPTDEKLTKESDCHLNGKEAIAIDDKKNDVNDLSQMGKKDETVMSVNGKMDENVKSVECDGTQLKNEIDETSVCEAKKCEVPENAVIAAVLEA